MNNPTLSPWLLERVQAAGALALEARAAPEAGAHQQAAELRAAYDALYDGLEAELYGETTAIFLDVGLLNSNPARAQVGTR